MPRKETPPHSVQTSDVSCLLETRSHGFKAPKACLDWRPIRKEIQNGCRSHMSPLSAKDQRIFHLSAGGDDGAHCVAGLDARNSESAAINHQLSRVDCPRSAPAPGGTGWSGKEPSKRQSRPRRVSSKNQPTLRSRDRWHSLEALLQLIRWQHCILILVGRWSHGLQMLAFSQPPASRPCVADTTSSL